MSKPCPRYIDSSHSFEDFYYPLAFCIVASIDFDLVLLTPKRVLRAFSEPDRERGTLHCTKTLDRYYNHMNQVKVTFRI